MSTRKSRTLGQLIRSYGIDKAVDLIARNFKGAGLQRRLEEAYPSAAPGVIRQLIDTARLSREVSRLTPSTKAQWQAQRTRAPLNPYQRNNFEYYTRVTVQLGNGLEPETWNIRIQSGTQLSHSGISELVVERTEIYRNKAIGESRERIRNSIVVQEVRVVGMTKGRRVR